MQGLRPAVLHLNFGEAEVEDLVATQNVRTRSLRVRKHLPNGSYVPLADQRELLQFPHAAGLFRAEQMAFAGVHAENFAGRGDLEAFGGAAMGL
jgi:hypothetical protein